jgi:threonine/homoserine/homoserine lactone efflux protein
VAVCRDDICRFGQRLAIYLRRAAVLKAFNRITGGAFVGFAGLMAAARN